MSLLKIPPELWIHIINELGSTEYPSAYELPPDGRHALSQLCLVNTAMKHLAEPVLYARLYITEDTLEHISCLLVVDEAAIDHAEGDLGVIHFQLRPSGTVTQKAIFVQSLTIAQFEFLSGAKELHEIASILRAVRSTLSRLFINFYDSSVWCTPEFPILKAALLELSNIEEFCFTLDYDLYGPKLWPLALFPKIKRLVTFYIPLDCLTDTIRSLPNLQALIAAHPNPDTLEEDLIPFSRAAEGLKSVMVVLDTDPDEYQPNAEHLSALMRRSGFRGGGGVFKMSVEGTLKAILEGELWATLNKLIVPLQQN
ncbi:hypothetical protein FRB95_004706 [Tulasnella sp. JGI-2019a]|nr:hypothetical protein FRB95_004706 [Tulasnella sp. JGI-2019a]